MDNINWVINRFQEFKDTTFLINNDTKISYTELSESIIKWKEKLNELGIQKGDSIAIIGDYSPDIIFLFLALALNNNIIVPLANETRDKHDTFLQIAHVNGVFKFSSEKEWSYHSLICNSEHQLLSKIKSSQEPGLVIFTSGTTGQSKGSVLQISKLIDKYKILNNKSYRTLVFLKIDHIGGINTLFSIVLTGGTIVIPSGRSPKEVCTCIEKHRIELLPTTPTFLNMLIISGIYLDYDLSSLRLITYGTEPMPDSTLKALNIKFPNVKLKQTYGLTELGIFSTKSRDSDSTWMKISGNNCEIKIVDNILWIRSPSAMLGYLNAPSPFSEDGWYNTGDQVVTDGEFLKILGRKTDIINVGGEKVYPIEVESILLEMDNVKEVIVTGKKNPITGNIVSAVFSLKEPEDLSDFKIRLNEYCKNKLEPFKIPRIIQITDDNDMVSDRFKKRRLLSELQST